MQCKRQFILPRSSHAKNQFQERLLPVQETLVFSSYYGFEVETDRIEVKRRILNLFFMKLKVVIINLNWYYFSWTLVNLLFKTVKNQYKKLKYRRMQENQEVFLSRISKFVLLRRSFSNDYFHIRKNSFGGDDLGELKFQTDLCASIII